VVEPVAAGVVFTGGGHVYTIENLFHFLRQLAAIIWLGGILAVNVLQVRIGTGNDRAAQASLLRQSDLYDRAVITPAAAVVLLSGLVLVVQDDLSFGEFWVVWGLVAVFVSLALGRR
jgi:putative copper export protein